MSDEQASQETTNQAQPTPSSTELALTNKTGEIIALDYGEYTSLGTAKADEGSRIPYLSLLQPLSKAVQEGGDDFVEGARPGMFLLGDILINGKEGCFFVGIEESHYLVEKTSLDGKGETVGEHDPHGPVAELARNTYGSKKFNWRSEKGNFLVERFDMYGMVYLTQEDAFNCENGKAAILGYERTKLRAREHVMSPFKKLPDNQRPPLFALVTKLTTSLEKGKKGDYYIISQKFANNDDFASSLIRPDTEAWARFAPEAAIVAKGVAAGDIKGSVNTEVGTDANGGDIPF